LEKRGLAERLAAENVAADAKVCWGDEMRLGLISQVRKVWCSIGTQVVQKVQISYKYLYLHLAVDGLKGSLHWQWAENMKQEAVLRVVTSWQAAGIEVIIWDGAPSHRANEVQKLAPTLICQPPYAPELNPAERIFEAVRQEVEGVVYDTLEEKKEAAERFLQRLAASPERIKSLAGWEWIRDALNPSSIPAT
jgi:predicted Zn-ribbon and HTH transcriptional regulator